MSAKDMGQWGVAGIILFITGTGVGLMDYFLNSNGHSLMLILISVSALFASIKMLSKGNLPVLKLLTGISLALALFSQAYMIGSQYSASLGLLMLATSAAEFRKDSVRSDN